MGVGGAGEGRTYVGQWLSVGGEGKMDSAPAGKTDREGVHEGRPYGGGVRWRMGEWRFPNRPYGEGVECRRCGKDGFLPPSTRGQALREKNG